MRERVVFQTSFQYCVFILLYVMFEYILKFSCMCLLATLGGLQASPKLALPRVNWWKKQHFQSIVLASEVLLGSQYEWIDGRVPITRKRGFKSCLSPNNQLETLEVLNGLTKMSFLSFPLVNVATVVLLFLKTNCAQVLQIFPKQVNSRVRVQIKSLYAVVNPLISYSFSRKWINITQDLQYLNSLPG